jgi:ProP effector
MSVSTKQADARAAIALLAKLFPKAFAVHEARRRPLKVGIAADLVAAVAGAIKPHELALALAHYCNNRVYLVRLRAGAGRIVLDGNPCGVVTIEEQRAAAEKLATRLLKAVRKKKVPPPTPEPTPAGPRRITLHDLRELATLRRHAGAG